VKNYLAIITFFLIVLFCGCVREQAGEVKSVPPVSSFADHDRFCCLNLAAIKGLKPGMSKTEVIAVLGKESIRVDTVVITNPYKSQIVRDREIVYYYTGPGKDKGVVSPEDLTPLIFEKGILIGTGFCEKYREDEPE